MKPPLRTRDLADPGARAALPTEPRAFLEWLGGPTLLSLPGRDPGRLRVVSTLLHGNEPSGVRALLRYLHGNEVPATDVLFFVASVGTALADPGFTHRALPGEVDANRCWRPPFDSREGEVAREVLARILEPRTECVVDIHNNTGHNPAYGVAFEVGPAEQALVALFADRVVHTPIELGTLVEATVGHCPSVTIECGRAGDPLADEVALAGLRRYLGRDEIDFSGPPAPLTLLVSPVRVCVRPGVELVFEDDASSAAPLTIARSIDRHNFERLDAGAEIGWVAPDGGWPIEAFGADGEECSRGLFEIRSGVLRTRRPFIPIMMTTNPVIAKSDCLFYAVQDGTKDGSPAGGR